MYDPGLDSGPFEKKKKTMLGQLVKIEFALCIK